MVTETAAEETTGRRHRPVRRVLIGLTALAVLAGTVLFLNRDKLMPPPEGCTVATGTGKGDLELAQAANAATITAVALSRGLPERAVTIALATAMQESKIHNLDGGDRDSVGLFQQRPSQGWGTVEQIKDPVYATNKFLDGLVKVNGYARLPLTDAAQEVQRSGFPQAYAKHETNATLLASALTGREPAALNCVVHDLAATTAAANEEQQQPGLADRARREFGKLVTTTPVPPAGKETRTVLAMAPQAGATQRQTGWALAQWAVAQAGDLGIGQVSYDGKVWKVDKPADGWQSKGAEGVGADRVLVTLGAPKAG
ncbi:hypothetical protein ASE03_03535 [Kitasatospora sp. Root187]|nr:hypothetical protein ASC99_01200 [Kitasatospora sp. Root107]KRB67424.1 hypothetical protein ASE03_03535 [Kitasatospora sp. Root187]